MTPEEELMKTAMEAWGRSDVEPLRAALHEDVVWKSASTQWDERIRSGGVHRGRASVVALMAKNATAYANHLFAAREIISKGEVVWGLFDVEARTIAHDLAETILKLEMAFRWRVRDGKIVEGQSFLDTAALAAQLAPG